MEETTTSDSGVVTTQPQNNEAVTTELDGSEQVITTDENGTPSLTPVTSQAPTEQSASEAVSEEKPTGESKETQAQQNDNAELTAWLEKKGLEINFDNPNEVKLAEMQRNAEKLMHEATAKKVSPQPPEALPESEDPAYNELIQRQNATDLRLYVRDWFEANPEAKAHRAQLEEIAQARPWLNNMDDVYAHFMADPSRSAELKQQGGREALQNLAQKQQQQPPAASATNSMEFQSTAITPQNVYELVDKNDQEWFQKNYEAINKAIAGKG